MAHLNLVTLRLWHRSKYLSWDKDQFFSIIFGASVLFLPAADARTVGCLQDDAQQHQEVPLREDHLHQEVRLQQLLRLRQQKMAQSFVTFKLRAGFRSPLWVEAASKWTDSRGGRVLDISLTGLRVLIPLSLSSKSNLKFQSCKVVDCHSFSWSRRSSCCFNWWLVRWLPQQQQQADYNSPNKQKYF